MRFESPLLPDADEARGWAEEELAKDAYTQHGESWQQAVRRWFEDLFNRIADWKPEGGFGSPTGILTILVIALLIGLAIWLIVGPVRRSRRLATARKHSVFEDDNRPAAEILTGAERAAQSGDWRTAVIESYRALIRSLEERDLIDDRPGITAHEAAGETSERFPDVAESMLKSADAFDATRYGHYGATESDYNTIRATDRALRGRTRLTAARR